MLGVVWFLLFHFDFQSVLQTAAKISPYHLFITFILVVVAALIASFRLFITARIFGYRISFLQSIAALSLGQIGGALFFQLAGQLMARGAWLYKLQIPISGTLVITGYERISALIASLLLAGAGTLYLFGGLSFHTSGASTDPIRLMIGLLLAAIFGAYFAWGDIAIRQLRRIQPKHLLQFAINLVASLATQIVTMTAYIALAQILNPSLNIFALAAASTLVMLAASIPISFAGWGVRELSAVAALGMIGLSADAAFVVAVMIGLLSLIAVGVLSLTALLPQTSTASPFKSEQQKVDYAAFIDTFIAIAVSSAILFQVFLPVGNSEVNVNLADPIALLGGALFIFYWFSGSRPQWRLRKLPLYIAICTLVVALSYIIGLRSIGWSDWAFTNKFLGWFVLLAYGATGALIALRLRDGFSLVMKTIVATACSIVFLEFLARMLIAANWQYGLTLATFQMSGFSQNRNAFGFALLICICCLLAARHERRIIPLGILLAAQWFSGSRAILGALPIVVAAAGMKRAISLYDLAKMLLVTGLIISFMIAFPYLLEVGNAIIGHLSKGGAALPSLDLQITTTQFSDERSNAERMSSIVGGVYLFLENPLFGAGLGAYFEQTQASGKAVIIHSTIIWLLAEMGIVGLLAFAVPALHLFLDSWKHANTDRGALVIFLIFLGFGITSLVHELLYQRVFWLILGLVIATIPRSKRKLDASDDTTLR